jgi:hypothetical protein
MPLPRCPSFPDSTTARPLSSLPRRLAASRGATCDTPVIKKLNMVRFSVDIGPAMVSSHGKLAKQGSMGGDQWPLSIQR